MAVGIPLDESRAVPKPERIKVLVIDDHEMFADGLVAVLDHEDDMEVVGTAGTVEKAVALASKTTPDVVLCDHLLPDGDGAEVAERVIAHHPQTRVVIVTQLADQGVIARAVEAGCSGFITKEKPMEDVISAVRVVAADEALISPAMLEQLLGHYRRANKGLKDTLTPREQEILQLFAEGVSTDAIAKRLVVSVSTVRNLTQGVLTKLGAHSKLEAVVIAMKTGLVSLPQRSGSSV